MVRSDKYLATQQILREYDWEVLMQLPCGPDLAPLDFHLFWSLWNSLESVRVGGNVTTVIRGILRRGVLSGFGECFVLPPYLAIVRHSANQLAVPCFEPYRFGLFNYGYVCARGAARGRRPAPSPLWMAPAIDHPMRRRRVAGAAFVLLRCARRSHLTMRAAVYIDTPFEFVHLIFSLGVAVVVLIRVCHGGDTRVLRRPDSTGAHVGGRTANTHRYCNLNHIQVSSVRPWIQPSSQGAPTRPHIKFVGYQFDRKEILALQAAPAALADKDAQGCVCGEGSKSCTEYGSDVLSVLAHVAFSTRGAVCVRASRAPPPGVPDVL
ncbi:hypothetical protein EVAR_49906_1 [Eumeta japonica]|uniref:Uncharacterized protein n=1 Tax=Eumeta variegata TaxID=151549 RepID=A0A4C1Y3V3_EUMVA|nr:hypothetical protein EVAR_49906_1 [Eumeta japonica]